MYEISYFSVLSNKFEERMSFDDRPELVRADNQFSFPSGGFSQGDIKNTRKVSIVAESIIQYFNTTKPLFFVTRQTRYPVRFPVFFSYISNGRKRKRSRLYEKT